MAHMHIHMFLISKFQIGLKYFVEMGCIRKTKVT